VRLTPKLEAQPEEVDALVEALDGWLARNDVAFDERLDGLTWLAQQLRAAKLEAVRGRRFEELVDLLVTALPEELRHLPIEPASPRQRSLLRQAVFARTEDPKIPQMARRGRVRTILSQLWRSRRFSRGRGSVPDIGSVWPRGATFEAVERVVPAGASAERGAVDDLITRWLRATLLGGRAWGAGFYGWAMNEGAAAMVLNLAAVGWLSRGHAAARQGCDEGGAGIGSTSRDDARGEVGLEDVAAALGRIDRSAGRARWLGGHAERLRLEYLSRDDGLRRLVRDSWFGSSVASASPA